MTKRHFKNPRWWSITPSQRCSQRILQPQPIRLFAVNRLLCWLFVFFFHIEQISLHPGVSIHSKITSLITDPVFTSDFFRLVSSFSFFFNLFTVFFFLLRQVFAAFFPEKSTCQSLLLFLQQSRWHFCFDSG